jgi:hypothetical protein
MATTVLEGGPNAIEAFIVGMLGELRADFDNDSLRLHDGVKEGGYEFLNRDAMDAIYQAHSAELDGFRFAAQDKGIVCRVGPALFRTRRILSSDADLDIVNPRGTVGDFDLNLSETIATPHTWSAVQTFVERIQAQDGLAGDTYGTHHGDVVGGELTGDFTGTGHGNFDGAFTGDVDVSGHNFVTDDGQILETQIDPEAWIRRGLPLGAIVMWSGTADEIPESFALCDGTNGTPDLRSRFIFGAGVGVLFTAAGSVGGSTTHIHTAEIATGGAHTHPFTTDDHTLTVAEMPAHAHHDGVVNGGTSTFNHGSVAADPDTAKHIEERAGSTGGMEGLTNEVGGDQGHSHTGVTDNSGAHDHDITVDAGSSMPPYYALCFIMKTV